MCVDLVVGGGRVRMFCWRIFFGRLKERQLYLKIIEFSIIQ